MIPSPALLAATSRSKPARETKFLLGNIDQINLVVEWAHDHLECDPHAAALPGAGYEVSTLYLDTEGLDVFHRNGSHGRHKYRIRRYQASGDVFLERKSKWGCMVRKERTGVPESELERLNAPSGYSEWEGEWFRRRIQLRALRPVCLVTYQRTAYVGVESESPIRLTLDRHLRCSPAAGLSFDVVAGAPVLQGQVILELKYMRDLPELFSSLIRHATLMPQSISKYRTGLRSLAALPD